MPEVWIEQSGRLWTNESSSLLLGVSTVQHKESGTALTIATKRKARNYERRVSTQRKNCYGQNAVGSRHINTIPDVAAPDNLPLHQNHWQLMRTNVNDNNWKFNRQQSYASRLMLVFSETQNRTTRFGSINRQRHAVRGVARMISM